MRRDASSEQALCPGFEFRLCCSGTFLEIGMWHRDVAMDTWCIVFCKHLQRAAPLDEAVRFMRREDFGVAIHRLVTE
jgi:hypothetical protein